MTLFDRWLLPDGVEELLPPQAWAAETLRRRLLDVYRNWGYELITPPLIEYLESLLTGTGNDLDLQTFKVTDQLTGRLMGVRADITPQAARIDARCWKSDAVNRFCYADSVLHALPENQITGRSPLQIGCELFGSESELADVEVIRLMVETVRTAKIGVPHLNLSHVAIYQGLLAQANVSHAVERLLIDALQRKSVPDLERLTEAHIADAELAKMLHALPTLVGDASILKQAQSLLHNAGASVLEAIESLASIAEQLSEFFPDVVMSFDLCELRGYNYHTGLVFAVFVPGYGKAVAKGGRYDAVGREFGRARSATGFSADLKTLVTRTDLENRRSGIFAPLDSCRDLLETIGKLRETEKIVQALSADDDPVGLGCDRKLVKQNGQWLVENL
ncbi:MAG: ATP phosphoribosyltransferase regulatory subunit [Pseudomonadales bacterium]|nr:ATP phosphoribosyltransferase regulatory subunit [Pseudomonadales bacterium]